MNLAWETLGLVRFLAVDAHGSLFFENGAPFPKAVLSPATRLIQVAYRTDSEDDLTIDLFLFARVLLPTLPDHTLNGLCHRYSIPFETGHEREALGSLFASLIHEALDFDPKLLFLLSQLCPSSLGQLFARLASVASPSPSQETMQPTNQPIPLPTASVESVLTDKGGLSQVLAGFEERPGQIEMAKHVAQILEAGGTLVAEAGSGTGKTFAYLIPSLLFLRSHDTTRIVISTRTKQLQEQIYNKDLPFLIPLFIPELKVALLKGRENYLCLKRWYSVLAETVEGLEQHLLPALALLATWLSQTDTGDIEENNAFLSDPRATPLWARLRDDPRYCSGPICPLFDDCFSFAARRQAKEANLVIVNHSLFLADLQSAQRILSGYSYLIVDEAHALEGVARNALTTTLTEQTIENLVKGLEASPGHPSQSWIDYFHRSHLNQPLADIREVARSLTRTNTQLFTTLASWLPPDLQGPTPGVEDPKPLIEQTRQLLLRLTSITTAINESINDAEIRHRIDAWMEQVDALSTLLDTLFSPREENMVHWYERTVQGIALHASPLEVAPFFREHLYPFLRGLILTSATLSLNGDFDYLRTSLGLDESPTEATYSRVEAPFSYQDRMRLYVATFLPPVDGPLQAYAKAVASLVNDVARTTNRKVLTLFTSYRLLHAVYTHLEGCGEVLGQGIDGPRTKIIQRFKNKKGGAVLLGTDSFWEGVNFPGQDMEILIITRLPFPVPTDPVLSALSERLIAQGRDPFREIALPRAVLKLRQGIGRLIRTENDRGAVILTDRRIFDRSYGAMFARSLPVMGKETADVQELLLDLASWFNDP